LIRFSWHDKRIGINQFSHKNENHPTLIITMFRLKTLFLNNHNDLKNYEALERLYLYGLKIKNSMKIQFIFFYYFKTCVFSLWFNFLCKYAKHGVFNTHFQVKWWKISDEITLDEFKWINMIYLTLHKELTKSHIHCHIECAWSHRHNIVFIFRICTKYSSTNF
jgi:hypothetical protein